MGYHGRASSIVVSGLPVRRPRGQVLPPGKSQPELQPSSVLDFELEVVRAAAACSQPQVAWRWRTVSLGFRMRKRCLSAAVAAWAPT